MSSLGRRAPFWRSLQELGDQDEFDRQTEHEFSSPFDEELVSSPGRRRFMQVMGASIALAGASGCRWDEEHLLPLSRRPHGLQPGETRVYSSVLELGGFGTGVRVTTYDGRPIKVDGNPSHPASLGATTPQQQATILELYDPDRSKIPMRRVGKSRNAATWQAFKDHVGPILAKLSAEGGKGLAVLAESSSSSTRARLKTALLSKYPDARWVEYEAVSADNEREGTRLAFGAPHQVLRSFGKAAVVLSLGADPIGPFFPGGLANARALSHGRVPDQFKMTRLYAVESSYSLFGTVADHRLALRPGLIAALAVALDARLTARLASDLHGPTQQEPAAAFLKEPNVARFVAAVVDDLLAARGASLVVAGPQQPPEVHALVCRLNALLGNSGTTVLYTEASDPDRPHHATALTGLTRAISDGQVQTLVMLGGNPAFTAPVTPSFESALKKVAHSIHLSLYDNETSRLSSWHLPRAHALETWGDTRSHDGTVSIAQPLIAPLYGGYSELQLLALLLGDTEDGQQLVRLTHSALPDAEWRRALHDGLIAGSALDPTEPTLRPLPPVRLAPEALGPSAPTGNDLELEFSPNSNVYDGRFANNAWLQELPDPITKLTWGNAALMSPRTARQMGVGDGEIVTLRFHGRTLSVPALHSPGHAEGSVTLSLGYGRRSAGVVGGFPSQGVPSVGSNAYLLRTAATFYFGTGLTLRATGRKAPVATTQHLHAIDARGRDGERARLGMIVREATLAEFIKKPSFPKEAVHQLPLVSMWQDPVAYEGHRWGMTIDAARCIGCNACVVACQSENNIPVVGQENVVMGREMHWLRVDRYYRGDPSHPEVSFQPVLCQHCENAPCEQVCPVGATMHSSEGLNDMSYNRCIGTRYCSNNCPYKVRRFNFFNYHLDANEPRNRVKQMARNPEVTLRARGVMEKCTFCVQRIQKGKIKAKNARRPLRDGEVLTACQQACPTEAIVFGDLNDPASRVAQLHGIPRAYALLGELNNRPRIHYLARVRNPNPELV